VYASAVMGGWYDAFSKFYDASLEALYAEHRELAAEALALEPGKAVLDVPCGTGLSFAAVARRLRGNGTIVGADLSPGMLRRAAARESALAGVRLITAALDVNTLSSETLQALTGSAQVDRLHVFLGMSVFPDMSAAFDRLWSVLAPGGRAVLVDVHAERLGLRGSMVNQVARADIRRRFWEPLQARAEEFALRDLPFRPMHGGQIKLAIGVKA
jgi:ubiquinone/menaquinone biosynthesis C-methylase UbiE